MKFKALLLLLLCIVIKLQAQTVYTAVDQVALQLPASESKTTAAIAAYINHHFTKPDEKARAIFCWITHNIAYDVENMYKTNLYQNVNEIVDRVVKTRKGICMSYTELFNDIATKTGLRSYAVQGYTKQNNKVDVLPHAWNAVFINGEWYLMDATWGAGYVQNGQFVRHITDSYFKAVPQQFINSHTPFDPLWQMLDYTVTNQDFYDGKTGPSGKKIFNYKEELQSYLNAAEATQLNAAAVRVEGNGVKNSLIYEHLQHLHQQLTYLHSNQITALFNDAVAHFNNGVSLLNRFINYRNNQFNPAKEETEIRQMVDTAQVEFDTASQRLATIQDPDTQTASTIKQLAQSLNQAQDGVKEQKAFADKYFKTGKLFRKTLFYKFK